MTAVVTKDTTTSTTAGTTNTTIITTGTKPTKRDHQWLDVVFVVATVVSVVVSFPSSLLAQGDERIAEIRVHGNHTTPDTVILDLSGLRVGDAVTDKSI